MNTDIRFMQWLVGTVLVISCNVSFATESPEHYAQNEFSTESRYSSHFKTKSSASTDDNHSSYQSSSEYKSNRDKSKSVFSNKQEQPFVPHPDYYNYQYMNPTANSLSN